MDTVNLVIFELYIFSHNSCFLTICEYIYPSRITFIIAYKTSCTSNVNFNTHKIAHFHKFAKIYTRENIYIHCLYGTWTTITCALNTIDPNPAISAHVVYPQSGHIRPEKRLFSQNFQHFSKLEISKMF